MIIGKKCRNLELIQQKWGGNLQDMTDKKNLSGKKHNYSNNKELQQIFPAPSGE